MEAERDRGSGSEGPLSCIAKEHKANDEAEAVVEADRTLAATSWAPVCYAVPYGTAAEPLREPVALTGRAPEDWRRPRRSIRTPL